LLNKTLNLTFQNIAFVLGSNVEINGAENSNITFNRDTFVNSNAPAACDGEGADFALFYQTATPTTPSGVTVENSVSVSPGDFWNPNRAMETEAPMTIANDVIAGYMDKSASCNHIDGVQLYSGSPGTSGGVAFTGNLCYDDYNCLAAWDGTSDNTITDNVCFNVERGCFDLYSDVGSVVNHNTTQGGGADPSNCATEHPAERCTVGSGLEQTHKSGDPVGSGETFTNNISGSAPSILDPSAIATNTNNMWPGAGAPNISGGATFAGGADPTTWAGFELTSGAVGHTAGSDGLDVGIRASAGGPPTGGGSTPVNTAAPSLSGTATAGDTLMTTNGTWTITGNVPTATTYQWFDCPTATFSLSSCTSIQAHTTAGNNDPTYTIAASDVGDYVFAYVTVTNANGQVNATSNAAGPVTG
jgi:hypothetical protein